MSIDFFNHNLPHFPPFSCIDNTIEKKGASNFFPNGDMNFQPKLDERNNVSTMPDCRISPKVHVIRCMDFGRPATWPCQGQK